MDPRYNSAMHPPLHFWSHYPFKLHSEMTLQQNYSFQIKIHQDFTCLFGYICTQLNFVLGSEWFDLALKRYNSCNCSQGCSIFIARTSIEVTLLLEYFQYLGTCVCCEITLTFDIGHFYLRLKRLSYFAWHVYTWWWWMLGDSSCNSSLSCLIWQPTVLGFVKKATLDMSLLCTKMWNYFFKLYRRHLSFLLSKTWVYAALGAGPWCTSLFWKSFGHRFFLRPR